MAPRIIIVEDEIPILELLKYNLESEGYEAITATDGEEALLLLSEQSFDLAILDWMIPKVSGIEICRRLRKRTETSSLPILLLTARGEEADRVRGFTTGADDYITKPFSVQELMARIKALLRRVSPGSRDVKIGPTEYRMLEVFMENPRRVLSRSQLLDRVWAQTSEIDERTVDVHIGRLRKALIRGNELDPIRTVRGAGYVFDGRDTTAEKEAESETES